MNERADADERPEPASQSGAYDEMRRTLDIQRAELNALTDDVRDLSDAVSTVADHLMPGTPVGVGGTGGSAPWCWQKLDDKGAAQLWRDIEDWVGWLRARYPIAEQLPACWWRHTELVEELTALRAVWNAATSTRAPIPVAPRTSTTAGYPARSGASEPGASTAEVSTAIVPTVFMMPTLSSTKMLQWHALGKAEVLRVLFRGIVRGWCSAAQRTDRPLHPQGCFASLRDAMPRS